MNTKELVYYFQTHKNAHTKGAGLLAALTHSNREDVLEARKIYRNILQKQSIKLPKILIFDIETAPMKTYVWKMWKENISIDQLINDWFVICWSAKWLYSNEVMGDCITSKEILQENDERIVKTLWKLFDDADIVIAHNALQFDVPKMNARFVKYGLNPPSPYKVIDTLQVAKQQFRFSSNKLDALAVYFGYPRKLDTDFELWKLCLEGKQSALDYMFKYNKYDVQLLEEVYLKLLPWIKNHPNINNYIMSDMPICSNCGHDEVILMPNKYYYTQINKYPIYRCKKCGAISRGRKSINNKATKVTSTAN